MIWTFINTGLHSGIFNMQFDMDLAKTCKENESFFRVYRWQPYCISLGANQNTSDLNITKAKVDGIDVVKRPTGGRAILHSEELTYSVIMPVQNLITVKEIYNNISVALSNGLSNYDSRLSKTELESKQPDFRALHEQPSGVLCFASTARNEVKFSGRKIIGSAQRKIGNVILQHGSILCGRFHRRLTKYLACSEKNYIVLNEELKNNTIEIEEILKEKVNYTSLAKEIAAAFEKKFMINFSNNIDMELQKEELSALEFSN